MTANLPLVWMVCVALAAATGGTELPQGVNLLPNGGFEVGRNHLPVDWLGNGKLSTQAHSGRYSLCIEKAPGGREPSVNSAKFALKPGASYRVSAWLKIEGPCPQDSVLLRVVTEAGAQPFELLMSQQWRKCACKFVAPQQARSGYLQFQRMCDLAKRIYLDDVEVAEVEAPKRPPVWRTDLANFEFPQQGSYVEYTAADFERARQQFAPRDIRQHRWVRQAEPLLTERFHFFKEGYASSATWLSFFNVGMTCPKDGTRLKPVVYPDDSHEMKCPKCGEICRTEANRRCARAVYNESVLWAANTLGIAYALGGDERFAQRVKEILLGFAGRYKTWEAGPHFSFNRLNDAERMVLFAAAYEYIRPCPALSPSERRKIEEDLFRPIAEFHLKGGIADRMNNRAAIYSKAVMAIGLALREKRFVEHALNNPDAGLHALSAGVFDADGLSVEGFGYQYYALSGLSPMAEMAYRAGINVYRDPAYRRIFEAPLHVLLPGEQNRQWAKEYQTASRRFEEAGQPLDDPFDGGGHLSAVPKSCYNFGDFGYGVLRSGEGLDQLYLTMEYGKETMFMGHAPAPKFALLLFANRRLLTPRGTPPSYGDALCGGWSRRSLAHHCVTVDDRDQWGRTPGRFLAFQTAPRVKVIRASDDETYGGVTLDRTLFLTDRCVIDLCAGRAGGGQHRWDLCYRNFGKLSCPLTFDARKGPLGIGHGYQYLTDVRSARTTAGWTADWRQDEKNALRLSVAAGNETEVIACSSPDNITAQTKVDAIVARRFSPATVFAAVWEPYRDRAIVSAIRPLPGVKDSEGAAVEVVTQGQPGAECFLASYVPGKRRYGDIESDGQVAAGRWRDAQSPPDYALLVGGVLLERGAHRLEASSPATLYVERLPGDNLFVKTGSGSVGKLTITGKMAPGASVTRGGEKIGAELDRPAALTFDASAETSYEVLGVTQWQKIRLDRKGGATEDNSQPEATLPAASPVDGRAHRSSGGMPAEKMQLVNGGFEAATEPIAGVPSPWQNGCSYHFAKFRARAEIDRQVAHTGKQSLKILQSNWANEATQDGWIEQKASGAGANKTCTLSAWVKANLEPTKVRLCIYGYNPRWGNDYEGGVSPPIDIGTQWQRISWTRSFGPEITDVYVMVKREHQVMGGDVWIDDVALEEDGFSTRRP